LWVAFYILIVNLINSCLQRDERVLVVWTDDFDNIIPLCREFEEQLIKLVWRNRSMTASVATSSANSSKMPSDVNLNLNEKLTGAEESPRTRPKPKSKWNFGWKLSPKRESDQADPEKYATTGPKSRPMRMFAPFYNGFGVALSICKSVPFEPVVRAY
jgi:hypothetical protein